MLIRFYSSFVRAVCTHKLLSALLVAVFVIVIFFVWIFFANDRFGGSKDQVRFREEYNLVFTDYQGNEVVLSSFKKKPLVVNVWASWCPYCKNELAYFNVLQEEYGDAVRIVAVNRAEPLSVAKNYTDALNLNGDVLFLLDPEDAMYKSMGGFAMPETLFVDKKGNVIIHKRGPMKLEEIREHIQRLIP